MIPQRRCGSLCRQTRSSGLPTCLGVLRNALREGNRLAAIEQCDAEQARVAIGAAHRAPGPWGRGRRRSGWAILRRWFDLIVVNSEDLARLIVLVQVRSRQPVLKIQAMIATHTAMNSTIMAKLTPTAMSDWP